MILTLEIDIDTADEDDLDDIWQGIIGLLEAAPSIIAVRTVVTVPDDGAVYLEGER